MDVQLIRQSLELVVEREPVITTRFYAILFERYPQVRPLFGMNTPEKQQKMLQEAVVAVVEHLEDGEWLAETLGNMGQQHVDYGVTEEMYPWVGECFLATLAEIAADDWNEGFAQAWGEALGAISGLMIAGARQRKE